MLPCLPAGREIRTNAKRGNVSYVYELGAFVGQWGNEKARQVFQHMLQLQQWGAFGFIDAEAEMRRL
ncbi:MAG: hypothetical protein IM558_00830 [Chitinophagaceae bacterium]|nr:hypothetical protein [Chitinophagaceae bacterium]